MEPLLSERHYDTAMERLLFSMIINRVMAPSSKLATEDWVSNEVEIKDLSAVKVRQLYRVMDFRLESEQEMQRNVFSMIANLFNLEVDMIFFDHVGTERWTRRDPFFRFA